MEIQHGKRYKDVRNDTIVIVTRIHEGSSEKQERICFKIIIANGSVPTANEGKILGFSKNIFKRMFKPCQNSIEKV